MARILNWSHSFTCTPRVHPLTEWTIPLPSQPKLVLIYRPQRNGRLSWSCVITYPNSIRTCAIGVLLKLDSTLQFFMRSHYVYVEYSLLTVCCLRIRNLKSSHQLAGCGSPIRGPHTRNCYDASCLYHSLCDRNGLGVAVVAVGRSHVCHEERT